MKPIRLTRKETKQIRVDEEYAQLLKKKYPNMSFTVATRKEKIKLKNEKML